MTINTNTATYKHAERIGIHHAIEVFGGRILNITADGTVEASLPSGGKASWLPDGTVVRADAGVVDDANAIMMMATAPVMGEPVILAVSNGFYFFGDLVKGHSDYATLHRAAMFGGFQGGKGLPGVARGDKEAKVTLDRFDEGHVIQAPLFSGAVLCIMQSINLYAFKGTALR